MTPDAEKCLRALYDLTAPDGEMCMPFAPLMEHTSLDRKTVRQNVRRLWRQGFAEYFRGLWTECGEPRGAGYCITKAGRGLVKRFCDHSNCRVWFPDDGPACPNHKDVLCALHGSTDTGG